MVRSPSRVILCAFYQNSLRSSAFKFIYVGNRNRTYSSGIGMNSESKNVNLDVCKSHAAEYAINHVPLQDNIAVGIGSGTTIIYAVKLLAERIQREQIKNILCVPSSYQAKILIEENGLTVGSLDTIPELEWTIDGADEVDKECNIIKGGGGCLAREKILAVNSKQFFVIVDYTKECDNLGTGTWQKGIPIEVIPIAYKPIQTKINKTFGGITVLRSAKAKIGPVITDNGNFILDWQFPKNLKASWKEVHNYIKLLPGVVEIGLFVDIDATVFIGSNSEGVRKISHQSKQSAK